MHIVFVCIVSGLERSQYIINLSNDTTVNVQVTEVFGNWTNDGETVPNYSRELWCEHTDFIPALVFVFNSCEFYGSLNVILSLLRFSHF